MTLFMPMTWLILGAVLLALELLDGSLLFFLPAGLGAWLAAGILKLQLSNQLFGHVWLDSWSDVLVAFAASTAIAMAGVRLYVRLRPGSPQNDINDY